jgi:hypothetical protein
MVNEAWTIPGERGWLGELMPPPHPTSRRAKETSNIEQEIDLRMDALLQVGERAVPE